MARARGVALHRALELQPLADSDLDAWRDRVRATFLAEFPDADFGEVEEIDAAADDLRRSLLWKQLSLLESGQSVLARELPLLVRSESDGPEAPTDGYVGALDLLYRDPDADELVVADFKTDAVADEVEARDKIDTYRPQLELYGRAVRDGLGLASPPRLELWLLALDRVVEVPSAGADAVSG